MFVIIVHCRPSIFPSRFYLCGCVFPSCTDTKHMRLVLVLLCAFDLLQMWVNDGVFDSNFVFENFTFVPQNDNEPHLTQEKSTFCFNEGATDISFRTLTLTDADEIVPSHRNIVSMSVSINGSCHNDTICGVFQFNQSMLGTDLTQTAVAHGIQVSSTDLQNGASIQRFQDILHSIVYTTGRQQRAERRILFKVSAE